MKKIVSFFLLSLVTITINGQHINIKSPQAYEMERYGNIPVDLSVGAIDLSIPIFKTNIGNQNFDISLKYNSSGFIPSKKSNYVGHDWFLNFGGTINRYVRGIPDDFSPEIYGPSHSLYGYLEGVRNCGKNNQEIYNYNYQTLAPENENIGITCSDQTSYEIEPDKFSFNFMGISGYFFIGNDGKPVVVSNNKNLKIDISELSSKQPLNSSSYVCFTKVSKIKIIDEKGIKYYFGGEYENLDIYYPFNNIYQKRTKESFVITSWNLYKIEYPNSDILEIKYMEANVDRTNESFCIASDNIISLPEPFLLLFDHHHNLKQEINASNFNYNTSSGNLLYDGTIHWGSGYEYYVFPIQHSFSATKKSFPKKILLNGREIITFNFKRYDKYLFHTIPSLKLETITINDENGNSINQIHFDYYRQKDVFFLNRISIYNKEQKMSSLVYDFDYYNKENIPDETTSSIDYWGFWNGKELQKLIPNFKLDKSTGSYFFTDDSREPNINLFSTGLLKSVIYPTKGKSYFIYEPHDYSKKVDRNYNSNFENTLVFHNGNVGGGRIKKIINHPNDNMVYSKEYKYIKDYSPHKENNNSSGILSNYYQHLIYFRYNSSLINYEKLDVFSNSFIESSMNTSPVLYSEVTEINNDTEYTKYYFTDYERYPDELDVKKITHHKNGEIINPKNIENINRFYRSNDYKRGKLYKKELYNENFTKIEKMEIEYTDISHSFPNNYVTHVFDRIRSKFFLKLYGGEFIPKKIINEKFFNGKTLETVTYNDYYNTNINTPINIKNTTTTYPDGHMEKTSYQYAHEKGNNYLINKNIVGIPLETTVTQDGKIISKTETIYPTSQAEANTKTQGLPMPVSSIGYDLENPSKTNQNITYTQYDNKGNLIEYKLNGITPVVIIWGYHQTLPIAKIEGATYDQVKNLVSDIISKSNEDKDEVSEKNLIMALDNFRNKEELKNFQITTYTHNPLIGVTSITPPSGIREIYKYDDANRLKLVLDIHGNILKEYNYHYAGAENEGTGTPSEYKNTALSRKFTKNNCTEKDYVGTEYTYNVPSGKYVSTISQADANQKAFDEIDANGQNEANRQGTCYKVYYNNEKRKVFSKKDCPSGNNSTAYTYIVPAKKYLSKISQDDADQKAEEEIKNRGQKQADQSLRCIPSQCAVTPIENPVFVLDKNTKISIKDGKVLISPPAKIKNGIYYGIGINTTLIGIIEDKCIPDTMLSHSYKPFEQERHIAINPNGEIFLSENPLFWSGPVLEPDEPIIELIPANKN